MSKMNKVLAIAVAVAASCVGVCCVPVLAAGCFFRIRPCVFTPFVRLRQFDAFVERFFESVLFHGFFFFTFRRGLHGFDGENASNQFMWYLALVRVRVAFEAGKW